MRKPLGLLLVALASICLVAAAVFRFYGPSHTDRTALDLNLTQRSTGSGSVLDAKTGKPVNGTFTAITKVLTDSDASNSKHMVVVIGDCVVKGDRQTCSLDPDVFVTASTERVSIGRKNAQPVDGFDSTLNGASVHPHGLTFKFPNDTAKHDYQEWVAATGSTVPARYQGTEDVSGLTAYKFTASVPQTSITTATGKVGYTASSTQWVEPKTGLVLKSTETLSETNAAGADVVKLDLASTPDSIKSQVKTANHRRSVNSDVTGWVPLILLILGVLFVLGAIVLLIRRDAPGAEDEPQPYRQPVPAGRP